MSSEVSALKIELDLCRAEMETERQTHQKEEKALRARVVEAEKQRDAIVQEALKNVEAMKNECNGIAGSFCFLFNGDGDPDLPSGDDNYRCGGE